MQQCPYCKINFIKNKWAAASQPRIICLNCRWYYEAIKQQNAYDAEMQAALLWFKKQKYKYLYDIVYRFLILIGIILFMIIWVNL